ARRHGEPDRERVLRRVRAALGLDDLRAGERVQGVARARAAIPGRPVSVVVAVLQGRRNGRGWTGRRSGGRTWSDWTGGRRGTGGGASRRGGSARYARTHDAGHRAADGESQGAAAGGAGGGR